MFTFFIFLFLKNALSNILFILHSFPSILKLEGTVKSTFVPIYLTISPLVMSTTKSSTIFVSFQYTIALSASHGSPDISPLVLVGILIFFSELQYINASCPMLVILSGIVMLVSELQLLNACSPMLFNPSDKVMLLSELQF